MKTKLLSILAISVFFVFAGCDDDDDSNNTNNTNNVNNTNNINNAECGNGIIDGNEVCDGTALDGEDCTTVGDFTGGTLACAGDCLSFNDAECTADATPTPDGFVGSSCADVADCTEVDAVADLTAECVKTIATFTLQDGYCSSTCDPAADPDPCVDADGECVDLMGMYQYCLKPCVPENNECRTGYQCAALSQEEGAPTYCLPPMGM